MSLTKRQFQLALLVLVGVGAAVILYHLSPVKKQKDYISGKYFGDVTKLSSAYITQQCYDYKNNILVQLRTKYGDFRLIFILYSYNIKKHFLKMNKK